jgi:hypothetical protein
MLDCKACPIKENMQAMRSLKVSFRDSVSIIHVDFAGLFKQGNQERPNPLTVLLF